MHIFIYNSNVNIDIERQIEAGQVKDDRTALYFSDNLSKLMSVVLKYWEHKESVAK